ncbi:MAG: ribosomal RNA small subunit methyltransferase A [Myxococcales bacterium]|nr:MAG: ribosomal RNA small subunit methyltransferase A [Myxococcales bacterium]
MPSPQAILKTYGLQPKKSWGQHFLADPHALARVVRDCALCENDALVVEIGAGTGALTERLVAPGRTVLAVEHDRELAAVLRDRFRDEPSVEIVEQDFLAFDLAAAAERAGGRIKVVGNIPYQITAPILFKLVAARAGVVSAHLLMQAEVARRLAAPVGAKDYSLLTVLLGRVGHATLGARLSPACFHPPPDVESRVAVVAFDKTPPAVPSDEFFVNFVKACFHQRRKRVVNSLRGQPHLALPKPLVAALAERFPELLARRAEALNGDEFLSLAAFAETWRG